MLPGSMAMTMSFVYDWPASMNEFGLPNAGKKTLEKGTVNSIVMPVTAAFDGLKNALAIRKSMTTVSWPIALYRKSFRSAGATATAAPGDEPTNRPNAMWLMGMSIQAIDHLRSRVARLMSVEEAADRCQPVLAPGVALRSSSASSNTVSARGIERAQRARRL